MAKTKVRSVRASEEFWERAEKVAKDEKIDTNKLIVKTVSEYCEVKENGRK